MNILSKLRINAGKSRLSVKMARIRRKPLYLNLYHIRTIGIVWDASRPEDFSILTRFHQHMAEQNREVTILGFFPGKELPDRYTAIRYFSCFKKNELNFFYCPVNPDVDSFINTKFDLLIDINFSNLFPLLYASSLSQAGLKVGLADDKPESSPFDLMISMTSPVAIDKYLEQVLYYLEIINSESAKKAV
ncbi:MAG TPA: hypothetical protein PK727_01690 [Bacteroidales bacterium]|jgi:hypothetical protein|nr:hypothetical protein [Bacteroidales bacterium]MDI9554147.1 hypothetical protein [Bacteroidota bacterium]MZP64677.1 hypothetical protein [Bacteroidales bacterium]NLK55368.1 hypothetical protein [Bacteroidales bacterium]HNY52686.1 hypothetical protein [Bacteroidales bacterium]